jgi:molybdopterin converting factor small subunit
MRSQPPYIPKSDNSQRETRMRVKVHYLGLVKTYTNKTQDDLTLPEETPLMELFEKLAATLGEPFNPEVFEPSKKEVKPTFMVLLNGVVIDPQEGLNAKLKDSDVVVIMPLVTGG